MALPGMKSTIDFVADERPKNWREGILRLSPRSDAPLYALTSMMKNKGTDDPEFFWWEKGVEMFNIVLSGNVDNAVTTFPLVANGMYLKPGDVLANEVTDEYVRVVSVVSDTSITVTRASSGTTAAAVDAVGKRNFIYIGSAYREGAPRSNGHSVPAVKRTNLTQIFRTPLEITGTANEVNLRTGDAYAELKRDALHKHSIGLERAFFLGKKFETTESGQPLRFTGGILPWLKDNGREATLGSTTTMEQLESYMAEIFAFGAKEKLVFASLASLIIIAQIVRKNSQYNWGPGETEYGINVKRLYTPAGTLVFMEHPLFGQAGQFLQKDLLILDTSMFGYRAYKNRDTKLLKDRQDAGTDGKVDEFLTEAGLEYHHAKAHYRLKGLTAAAKDA